MDETGIEVFISSASEDYRVAEEVFRHLKESGMRCFFSEQSIDGIGKAAYKRVIDGALEECRHLVVVTSSRANVEKEWVRYEWDTFALEQLAGRKHGNLITMAIGVIARGEMPLVLRQNQVLRWPAEKGRLLPYLRVADASAVPKSAASPTIDLGAASAREDPPIRIQPPFPARAEGTKAKLWRGLLWLLVRIATFFWRPPIWGSASRDALSSAWAWALMACGDALIRLARLILLAAATFFFGFMIWILASEPEHQVGLKIAWVGGSAVALWCGWLTRGRCTAKK